MGIMSTIKKVLINYTYYTIIIICYFYISQKKVSFDIIPLKLKISKHRPIKKCNTSYVLIL